MIISAKKYKNNKPSFLCTHKLINTSFQIKNEKSVSSLECRQASDKKRATKNSLLPVLRVSH